MAGDTTEVLSPQPPVEARREKPVADVPTNGIENEGGSTYDESKIQVLEGIEHVRARPSMYIGDIGARGLHHLIFEVVDNSIDEAMAGACHNIDVVLHAGGSCSVTDDGRGIPVGIKEGHGVSALELCLTQVGAGGKFDRDSYKVSGGLHGVGVTVVNALSEWCEATVQREGKIWVMRFERGKTVRQLEAIGATNRTGTRIEFKPDGEVFSQIEFSYDVPARRLRELAYLNAGLNITIVDERQNKREVFCFEKGILQFVEHLNEGKDAVHPVVHFRRDDPVSRLIIECAFQYCDNYTENLLSFANNINTHEGGTHLTGFKTALSRVVNNYAKKNNLLKANDPTPTGDDIREGITAVISVMVPEPQFEGQTKTKLGNGEVGTFVESVVGELLSNYLEEHPAEAKRIVGKAVQAALAREAARKARETVRKSAMAGGGLSRKLVDCSSRDIDETEIFIVEGDSAAGSAKGYRDSATQAILPIRGKILNVEKARLHKILSHEEILEIIKALGTGIGLEDFDVSKLRYGKIILMTDADVDGSHIRTLLLTFLFRHMRALIDSGKVFIAQPPLYQLAKGKSADYVIDDGALNGRLTRIGVDGTTLEMNRPGQPPVTISGAQLAGLIGLLEEIERQAKILARRGIVFDRFIQDHMENGKLPAIRALVDRSAPVDGQAPGATGSRAAGVSGAAQENFFFTDEEFEVFQRSNAAAGVAILRQELGEARVLQRCLTALAEYGCATADLFARREELVTGDMSAAVFVLRHGDEPLELANLLVLPNGIRQIGGRGWEIKRFKGLGEMNPEELWETTMNPAKRVLRKVVVGEGGGDVEQDEIDAVETDRIFSILMGENVESRRAFIDQNAIHVKNLDV